MENKNWYRIGAAGALSLLGLVLAFPILANPQTISIAARPTRKPIVVRGFVRGTMELHNVVGDRDQANRRCMGYSGAAPDHLLEVTPGVAQLSLQVRSNARDTTLIVRGPNQQLFCADDSNFGKDAGLKLSNLTPGKYTVWVGSFDPGQRFSYRLILR